MTAAARSHPTERTVWAWYLAAGVLAVLAYGLVPAGASQDVLTIAVGLSPVLATCAARRRLGAPLRAAWLLGGAGQLLFAAGDLVWIALERMGRDPFPSLADVCYLAGYAALACALLLFLRVRAPGADWASLLDAAIAAGGGATLAAALLLPRYARMPLLERLVALAYPALDVLLLALALRVAFSAGHRNRSFQLLVLSLAALLVADVSFGHGELTSSYLDGGVTDIGWLLSYILWGTAVLHPAAGDRSPTPRAAVTHLRTFRLVLLAGACATSPALLLVEHAHGDVRNVRLLAGASIALSLLVLVRLAVTVHQNEAALAWEHRVREAVAMLMAATGETAVSAAAVNATCSWVPDAEDVAVLLDDGGRLVATAAAGAVPEGAVVTLPAAVERELRAARVVEASPVPDALRDGLSLGPRAGAVSLVPLVGAAGRLGTIVIATGAPPTDAIRAGIEMLGAQASLALEAAADGPETQLARQEAAFLSLLHGPDEFVAIVAPDGTVSYHSPGMEAALGYADGDLPGTPLARIVHPEDAPALAEAETSLAAVRLRRRDGTWAGALVRTSPRADDQLVGGLLLTARLADAG